MMSLPNAEILAISISDGMLLKVTQDASINDGRFDCRRRILVTEKIKEVILCS